jgi:hypothetical protein
MKLFACCTRIISVVVALSDRRIQEMGALPTPTEEDVTKAIQSWNPNEFNAWVKALTHTNHQLARLAVGIAMSCSMTLKDHPEMSAPGVDPVEEMMGYAALLALKAVDELGKAENVKKPADLVDQLEKEHKSVLPEPTRKMVEDALILASQISEKKEEKSKLFDYGADLEAANPELVKALKCIMETACEVYIGMPDVLTDDDRAATAAIHAMLWTVHVIEAALRERGE